MGCSACAGNLRGTQAGWWLKLPSETYLQTEREQPEVEAAARRVESAHLKCSQRFHIDPSIDKQL